MTLERPCKQGNCQLDLTSTIVRLYLQMHVFELGCTTGIPQGITACTRIHACHGSIPAAAGTGLNVGTCECNHDSSRTNANANALSAFTFVFIGEQVVGEGGGEGEGTRQGRDAIVVIAACGGTDGVGTCGGVVSVRQGRGRVAVACGRTDEVGEDDATSSSLRRG